MRADGTLLLASGAVEFELYGDEAPETVAAFVEAIRDGLWNGGSFVRTVRADNDNGAPQIDVIQAAAAGEAVRTIAHESTEETGLKHLAGTLSVPRNGPGTGSSAGFFVCMRDSPELDAGSNRNPDGLGFAAFGRVTSGLDLLRAVHLSECLEGGADAYISGQELREPVEIVDMSIL